MFWNPYPFHALYEPLLQARMRPSYLGPWQGVMPWVAPEKCGVWYEPKLLYVLRDPVRDLDLGEAAW